MNARFLCWLVAVLPLLAVVGWAALAPDLPEPASTRQALGEMATVWTFDEWLRDGGGPLHLAARALHLAALEVPGATARSVLWLNVVCVLWLASSLATVARRAFSEEVVGRGAALVWLFVFGLLVASPGYGSNWLHAERVGVFLAPALLVTGIGWLQVGGRFPLRAGGVVVIAGLAPLCHANGMATALALIPALMARCRVSVSVRAVAWLGALLVVGNLASWFALRTAPSFGAADADLFAHISRAPREMAARILTETGAAWLDLVPTSTLDEHALGLLSWTLPLLLLLPVGRRDEEALARSGPWWSCLVFGLAVTAVAAVRYELSPPVGTTREAVYGAFLLPLGTIGLLAIRFGAALLPFAAGALVVLGIADWHAGLEDLRRARVRAAVAAARLVAAPSGVRAVYGDPSRLDALVARGVVPLPSRVEAQRFADVGSPRAELGRVTRVSSGELRGEVFSSLRGATAAWLVAVVEAPGATATLAATCWPDYAGAGRVVPWSLELPQPLAAGAQVRVAAWLPEEGAVAAIGPRYRVRGGALVVDDGT